MTQMGKKTCHQPNGSSVVDYVLADESLLDRFQYLKVEPLKSHLSDNCGLSYSLSLDFEHIQEHPHPLKPAPIQYTWRKGDEIEVKSILKCKETTNKIELFNSTDFKKDANQAARNFSDIISGIYNKAGIKQKSTANKQRRATNQKWFDLECRNEKSNLESLGKLVCRNPADNKIRRLLFIKKRNFRKLTRNKKKGVHKKQIE